MKRLPFAQSSHQYWPIVLCFLVLSACKRLEIPTTPEQKTPKIIAFSPTSGQIGTVVTITGENFGSSRDSVQVKFGSVAAEIDSISSTRLVVRVPDSAVTAPIFLTVHDTTVASADAFTVLPPPFNFRDVVIEVSGVNALAMHKALHPVDTTYLRQLQLTYTIDTIKYYPMLGFATCTGSSLGDTFKINCRSMEHLGAARNATDILSGWVVVDTVNHRFHSLSFQHSYEDASYSSDDILRLDTLVATMVPYTGDSWGDFVGEVRGSAFPASISLFRHMDWQGDGFTRYADTVKSLLPTGDEGYIRVTLKR